MIPIKKSNRHTANRRLVLRVVKMATQPVTAAEVAKATRIAYLSAVYRNLNFLKRRGEIAELEGDDGVKRYIGQAWHWAEFRCVRCGRVRHLKHKTLPGYVDRKMFGHQSIVVSQLKAQGLCGACVKSNR